MHEQGFPTVERRGQWRVGMNGGFWMLQVELKLLALVL